MFFNNKGKQVRIYNDYKPCRNLQDNTFKLLNRKSEKFIELIEFQYIGFTEIYSQTSYKLYNEENNLSMLLDNLIKCNVV